MSGVDDRNQSSSSRESEIAMFSAMDWQSDYFTNGNIPAIGEIANHFPTLARDTDKLLTLVYHEYQLRVQSAVDIEEVQSEYIRQFPKLGDALRKQFEFSNALEQFSTPNSQHTVADSDTPQRPCELFQQIGRFSVTSLLGYGGMGTVFLARDSMLKRNVAIKVPSSTGEKANKTNRKFLREARLAAHLRHTNLLEVFEIAEWKNGCYIVMRWAQQGDLSQLLTNKPAPYAETHVLKIMSGIADGLAYCHDRNIVHLDLKPANILFDEPSGDVKEKTSSPFPGPPLVSDFGVARVLHENLQLTQTNSILGTPLYMSPEQIEGDRKKIGKSTDVFSCGVLMYQMLTGIHPFSSNSALETIDRIRNGKVKSIPQNVELSRDARYVLNKCLSTDPILRYPSARELHSDLQCLIEGRPIPRSRLFLSQKTLSWMARNDRISQAATVAVIVNTSIICSFAFAALFIGVGLLGNDSVNSREFALDAMKLAAFPHAPMIVIGVLIQRGRRRLHVINTLFALSLLTLVSISLLVGRGPVAIYNENPLAFFMSHIIIFGVALVQAIVHLLALPATRRRW